MVAKMDKSPPQPLSSKATVPPPPQNGDKDRGVAGAGGRSWVSLGHGVFGFLFLGWMTCMMGVVVLGDSSWSTSAWTGWKGYLQKLDVAGIWSNSASSAGGEGSFNGSGISGVKPNFLYSAEAIQKLAALEGEIYTAIKAFSVKAVNERRILRMRRYIQDYEESSVNAIFEEDESETGTSQNAKNYAVVANPIIAHRIIRRFSLDIPSIRRSVKNDDAVLSNDAGNEFLEALENANPDKMLYPIASEDYNNSLYSLLRIQRYSNISTEEMVIGQLGDLKTGVGLQARHALELGAYAARRDPPFFTQAIEWLEMAMDKFKKEETLESQSLGPKYREVIQMELKEIVEKHDEYCSSPSWVAGMENCFAFLIKENYGDNRPENGSNLRLKGSDRNNENAIPHRREQDYSANTRRNFLNTCSGRNLQTEEEKARLHCWYEIKRNPYLRICPLKIELLNEFPPLIQIYDILGPQRRRVLMEKANPNLVRSLVVNVNDPKASDISDVRTSVQTWIYDDHAEHAEFLDGISRQIEYVTGLNVRMQRKGKTAEAYQVASYRSSHHYDEHMDALMDERRTSIDGDRIGTFMFYLTDVEVGGMTGFPTLGTAAKPVAGSAVFWYNLWRNGTGDKRTWHGGCPVVHGVKWVTNKWILAHENFDTRLCSLNQLE